MFPSCTFLVRQNTIEKTRLKKCEILGRFHEGDTSRKCQQSDLFGECLAVNSVQEMFQDEVPP